MSQPLKFHTPRLDVTFHSEPGLLRVVAAGSFELQSAKAALRHVFNYCVRHGKARVLLDCLAVAGAPALMERYDFGQFFAAEQHRLRRERGHAVLVTALVGREPLVDRGRFAESVAVNRGAILKVTTTIEEALEWLKSAG